MVTVGVLAHFEVRPDSEEAIESFSEEGLPTVRAQPPTTTWFAFRISEMAHGAFAVFATDADGETLLATGGPRLSRKYADLFTEPPTFEKVDVLEARLPGEGDG
ncbi:MAG TPA: antibiotic biosynthesis monooxygenase [Candidatus Dormibacteraeota bacterium]|jgi:hypothetical protein|nr:antibiotic biosynthesis monooxygenase [Candidatus Dormibacteraeota bacterium]